jgi:hypothetical protein
MSAEAVNGAPLPRQVKTIRLALTVRQSENRRLESVMLQLLAIIGR